MRAEAHPPDRRRLLTLAALAALSDAKRLEIAARLAHHRVVICATAPSSAVIHARVEHAESSDAQSNAVRATSFHAIKHCAKNAY
jgi:hypothetical protein